MNTKRSKKLIDFLDSHKLKLAVCAVLIVSLFVTPALTQAQYKWTLDGYQFVQAKEFHFSSNYLKSETEHAYYFTSVWDGYNSPIQNIDIRNFDNSLLCNNTGEDIYYKFSWKVTAYDPNGVEITSGYKIDNTRTLYSGYKFYQVSLNYDPVSKTSDGDVLKSDHCYGIILGDGTTKKDNYTFFMESPALDDSAVPQRWTAPEGSRLRVELVAYNTKPFKASYADYKTDPIHYTEPTETIEASDSFYSKMTAVFEFMVTSSTGFIKQFDITEKSGTKDIELNIGTGVVPDEQGNAQAIYVWWRKDRIQMNPICKTFTDMINIRAGNYTTNVATDSAGNKIEYCQLMITGLQSHSNRLLNLYKLSYDSVNRTDTWFTDSAYNTLVVANKSPVDSENISNSPIFNGAILGYYVSEIDGTE